MALPNTKELQLLDQFRLMLSDLELTEEQRSDSFLVAWLRARDLDLKQADEMLRKSIQWRKENDLDNILEWEPPANFLSEYYFEITGQTEDGCPVLVVPVGKWDIRKAVESGNRESWLKYIDHMIGSGLELGKQNAKRVGHPVTQAVVICDFEGFGMRQLTSLSNVNTMLEFVKRFESNYPEMLRNAYIVNANRIFKMIFSIVKPFISGRTLSKLQIYGSNPKEWESVLLNNIPQAEFSVELGGSQIGYGTKLKEEEESEDHDSGYDEDEDVQQQQGQHVVIRPGDKFTIDHVIEEEEGEATLNWRFNTVDYDIGFTIMYNDEEQVLPYQRTDSHLRVQQDSLHCDKPGKYSLVFDNSHSPLREKHLYCSTDLVV